MKNSKNKRIAVILLSLIMMLTMMPSAAFGAGEDSAAAGQAAGAETGNTAGTETGTDEGTAGIDASGAGAAGTDDVISGDTGSKLECSSSLYSTYQLTYRDETEDDKAVPVIDDDSADAASDKDKASSSKSVKTGDETFLVLWIAVLLVALVLGFVMLIIYKKNLDKRDKSDRE